MRLRSLPDVPFHLQGLPKEAGFVNMHKERRRIPMCGEEGKDMLQDAHTVLIDHASDEWQDGMAQGVRKTTSE